MQMRYVLLCVFAALTFAQGRPFDVETLLRIQRIGDPALSPDGRLVAYTVATPDLDKNAQSRQIYVVPVSGGPPRLLTRDGTTNERARWSPDSKQIYFISNSGGVSQVWAMDSDGSRVRQITKLSTEAGGVIVSPDGKKIVFQSSVYPDCGADDAGNKRKLDAHAKAPANGRVA